MKHFYLILSLIVLLALPAGSHAFPTTAYTQTSALAEGSWMKIAVETDGVYLIPTSRLRSWGFSDPSQVVVRGYGGRRQSDILNLRDYIDDLPEVQSVVTDRGIVFYGVGAGQWRESTQSGYFYYRQNDFSTAGHYFVGLRSDSTARTIPTSAAPHSGEAAAQFTERVQHESELVITPGEAGPMLLGEDFRYTRRHKFTLAIPDAVPGAGAWLQTSFVSNLKESGARLTFSVAGESLPVNSTSNLRATNGDYVHGSVTQSRYNFDLPAAPGANLEVEINLQCTATPAGAWLNYLVVNYPRYLRIPSAGYLNFTSGQTALKLETGGKPITVWDVTDPRDISVVNHGTADASGAVAWAYPTAMRRNYAAWRTDARLPEPAVVGRVNNQNLHAVAEADMVIVTPQAFMTDANRLAEYHRNSADSLKVEVVTPEMVYNEFSSGTVDVGGLRRFFKMLYDRGLESGRPLRYAILMGRTTLDNRGLTVNAPSYPTVPSWMSIEESHSVSDNLGYCTDDFTAMLADGSGSAPGSDKLSIAIGRIPVTDANESRDVVDKILQYAKGANRTAWKQRFMFLADDQNNGVHLEDSEDLIKRTGTQNPYFINKVYMDAYVLSGSEYPEARKIMFRNLEDGVVWWNFIGHASKTGWTHEHQLTYTDLNNMYLRHWPFIYAATCDFMRLDGAGISGGETLFKERYGGAIGVLSAIRPVYISANSYLSLAVGRALAERDDKGLILPPGEVARRAKNDLRRVENKGRPTEREVPVSDENRLRYMFIGDPALRLAMPSNYVVVDSINGIPVNEENQPTLAALQRGRITGRVTSPKGELLSGFNGVLMVDIFDAEHTVTTNGNGEQGKVMNFEDHGERVYTGSVPVAGGRFDMEVAMPLELSQNFRPATMSLYAYDTTTDAEAAGLTRDFYVYGFDETVESDIESPVIESLVLNHEDFENGETVNTTPMLIAKVSDNVGINVSSAGIGHQITAILDGRNTYSGVANYYTPSPDGSPSGVVNYPFDELQPGNHSLTFRVWDTAGNSAEKTIDFNVAEGLAPKIYDIYSDANPASTVANFYLRHNQPDQMVSVTVTVYNLLGRPLWSRTVDGRSDMFLTMPVSWDLTDATGRRVGRGIYLYRATITTDGQNYDTGSRRIAVTAR